MTDPMKQAWEEVGDGFATLGRLMKDKYKAGPARPAPTDDAHDGRAALRDALENLVDAAREVGERTSDVVVDADIKAQAKEAVRSLNAALSATVEQIGEEVGGLFKRGSKAPPAEVVDVEADVDASADGAADVDANADEFDPPPVSGVPDL